MFDSFDWLYLCLVLTKLHIRNYAIIDEIEISFRKGLTIITGETGAGKSILIGALSLVLGERADVKSLWKKDEKCIIEATFDIDQIPDARVFLEENDLEADDELIIRREMSVQGKSRVFINDTPSTLLVLNRLSAMLIDMHRQFETQELQQSSEQLNLVDAVCRHDALLQTYQSTFRKWKNLQLELHQLSERNRQIRQELDYNQFLYNELETFQPRAGELEEAETELTMLTNSEALKLNLQQALQILREDDQAVLMQLRSVLQSLDTHAKLIPSLHELRERIESARIELKDISAGLEDLYEHTHYDQEKIDLITERLNEGNRLLKKHGLHQSEELLALKHKLEEKIHTAVHASQDEEALLTAIAEEFSSLQQLAGELHTAREAAIPGMEKTVNALLKEVGMPNARIRIDMSTIELNRFGQDKVEIVFDANKTGHFAPIAKAASGGELSRLMLCIKSLLADSSSLPTLVFDEIDTGISGETALQVGKIMQALSREHQLICITHLPQIAGKADQHLYIYKEANASGQIITHLKELAHDERVDTLAEMLSGKEATNEAKATVKQLMK